MKTVYEYSDILAELDEDIRVAIVEAQVGLRMVVGFQLTDIQMVAHKSLILERAHKVLDAVEQHEHPGWTQSTLVEPDGARAGRRLARRRVSTDEDIRLFLAETQAAFEQELRDAARWIVAQKPAGGA